MDCKEEWPEAKEPQEQEKQKTLCLQAESLETEMRACPETTGAVQRSIQMADYFLNNSLPQAGHSKPSPFSGRRSPVNVT